jgi:lysophospholipase L1-like esterase
MAALNSFAIGQESAAAARKAAADKWARHYHERVAQFERENVPRRNVVIVGSSHVEGLDAAALLPRWQVVNRGIAADRIGIDERGILHRLDSSVFDCDPSVVVLQNGVNDLGELWRHGTPSLDEIEACYRKVVQKIRGRLPDVPVIIVGLFPTRDKYAELVPLITQLDARLKQIAQDYGCMFLEMYPSLADSEGLLRQEYSREGLHLTEAGYEVWARMLDEVLARLMTTDETALDPATALREPESDLLWYDARQLVVEGKGWTDTEGFYERLPARAKPKVPEMVWTLGKRTAGLAVRFKTDSKTIAAIWDGGGAMNHMAATGNSGLDLYVRRGDRWVFCGVGRPQTQRTTANVAKSLSGELAEYLLYLPLYSGVTELRIGIEQEARMVSPPPRPAGRDQPLVFYGTSITQGGCASRAGMCHPAILGRWFDREVLNLGFSGSGKMEPELAHLLGELDAAVFVLECLPNMTTEMVSERVGPFVRILRAAQPATPILLVESPLNPLDNPGNQALRNAFAALTEEGVGRLYYLPGESQLAGTENGTVDGVHPTDLGFNRMAVGYEPVLEAILTSHQ